VVNSINAGWVFRMKKPYLLSLTAVICLILLSSIPVFAVTLSPDKDHPHTSQNIPYKWTPGMQIGFSGSSVSGYKYKGLEGKTAVGTWVGSTWHPPIEAKTVSTICTGKWVPSGGEGGGGESPPTLYCAAVNKGKFPDKIEFIKPTKDKYIIAGGSVPLKVEVTDQNNDPASGYKIDWSINQTGTYFSKSGGTGYSQEVSSKLTTPGGTSCTATAKIKDTSISDTSKKITVFGVETQTVATTPADRTRTTIGIGEKVICSTNPSLSVAWSVTGGGSVSPATGTSTTFTASKSPSTSTVHAKIGKADYTLIFTVIAPTSITSVKKADVGLGTVGPPNNQIGAYTTYDITVNPTTVSFKWAELRENIPKHSWTWPNGTSGGMNARICPWIVGYDNKTVDNISDGPSPIGYIHNGTSYVDFNYIITWQEEYKNKDGIWTQWIAAETTNTEYRGADQKCRETHMGAAGGWQGPWQ
jgi:hypothetical protein